MAVWQFRPLNPNENSGTSTVDDNFADEQRSSTDILVRESIQNPLDARTDGQPVKVRYCISTVVSEGSKVVSTLLQESWLDHAIAGKLRSDHAIPTTMSFLIIEDFGTSGLEGNYRDSSVDGETENWNAFWFREGEGAKRSHSNGGAGQGKITLYLASAIRTVLAVTIRRSDRRQLAFGCSRFKRNYKFDNNRWSKEARWGACSDSQKLATPIDDQTLISSLKKELYLKREDLPGTSFIIPLPDDAITVDAIKQAVINEFFFAIIRGRLSVDVGSTSLNAYTIESESEALGDRCRLSREYREFLRVAASLVSGIPMATAKSGWNVPTKLEHGQFDDGSVALVKEAFELGNPVVIELPITIREKGSDPVQTSFRVVLKQAVDDDVTQELFVRQDLAIDSEKRLTSLRSATPVMALTYIDHPFLSDLLVCAEEPTHRSWNARRPKVLFKYASPDKALHAVRNAALRILLMISPQGKRDDTALSLFFADPSVDTESQRSALGRKRDGKRPENEKKGEEIPYPKPKPVLLTPQGRGFVVAANPRYEGDFRPVHCEIDVAYATASGDSYNEWDSADFWLPDDRQFMASGIDIGPVTRGGNTLEFRMLSLHSKFSITGFDPERQLNVRVKYREAADGSDL